MISLRAAPILIALLLATGVIAGCGHQLTAAEVVGTYHGGPNGEGGMWVVLAADGTWHEWAILDGKEQPLNRGTYRIEGDRLELHTAQSGSGVSTGSIDDGVLSVTDPDGGSGQWTKQSDVPKPGPSSGGK